MLTYIDHLASVEDTYVTGAGRVNLPIRITLYARHLMYLTAPPRITPKPVVQGTQTAIVTGPAGETIFPDKYGRVKVKFHWDRESNNDDKSSCWVRVSQAWAGQGWGSMHIPHVGQEVIVDFFEGDPDRPHITGRLYHGNNMPADALPGEKTKSVFRDHGGNEQIIEGKDGVQFIHTKQFCGNEFLIDGSSGGEKIELRDKYGNEIVMDAVTGTIRIYSPTHESGIELGKSVEMFSTSHFNQLFKGSWFYNVVGELKGKIGADITELYVGAESKQTLGWRSRLCGGWKQEIIVGAETKSVNGLKKEIIRGTVFKRHYGLSYEEPSAGKRDKMPSFFQKIKDVKQSFDNEKVKVKAARSIEIGETLSQTAKAIKEKAESDLELAAGDEAKMKAPKLRYDASSEFLVKSAKSIVDAGKILEKADEIKLKGSKVSLL